MVEVEFVFNTGKEKYLFPTKWEDITLEKYIEIQNLPEKKIASISKYYSSLVTDRTLLLLKFMTVSFEPSIPEGFSINIGRESWGKLEKARIEIGKLEEESPDFISLYKKLIEIYSNFEADNISCVEGVGLGKYLFEKIAEFFEQFKELTAKEEDAAADIADTSELDALGFLVSLDELAKGDILKYDELLKQPALTIYRKFLLDKRKATFQKN
jgi:hypothetical protein